MKSKKMLVWEVENPLNRFICGSKSKFCRHVGLKPATLRTYMSRKRLTFGEDTFYYKGYHFSPIYEL